MTVLDSSESEVVDGTSSQHGGIETVAVPTRRGPRPPSTQLQDEYDWETCIGLCCGGFLCWPCIGKEKASEYGRCFLAVVLWCW
ncbi:hypothetical protein PTSG_11666 [Salpingoeca rosetta]|uniref:Uncharacterized protein n=1 Tax=Salpingoeca rosetta (strain ATCC 50818 / BSB-021) TaxID=946362 RepID=F2TY11_SALR5|nr:uncharacterized protein PTSG_11666 [Salpingoeca rosetta]EGD76270.1 hypothetical protein PTSG_11666 [Salpingoeca rosetta]|eukprot:XP_004998445.1 hypothetical protein PTSG_11666 [Salpingoeca rosetta]